MARGDDLREGRGHLVLNERQRRLDVIDRLARWTDPAVVPRPRPGLGDRHEHAPVRSVDVYGNLAIDGERALVDARDNVRPLDRRVVLAIEHNARAIAGAASGMRGAPPV